MRIMNTMFLVIGLIVLAGCSSSSEEVYEEIEISTNEKVENDAQIVTVNGEEIDGKAYNDMYLQMKTEAIRIDENETITPEELQEKTIDTLVNDALFLQLAEDNGIMIDHSDMEEDLKRLKKLDESGYQELKSKFNYTEEGIANQIRLEKARKEYIDKFISVEVTKEEVKQYYDETASTTEEDLPDFESAYQTLKETLEVNQALEQVADHIDQFKEESTIEIHF